MTVSEFVGGLVIGAVAGFLLAVPFVMLCYRLTLSATLNEMVDGLRQGIGQQAAECKPRPPQDMWDD